MILHGRSNEISQTQSIRAIEYRAMWAYWFHYVNEFMLFPLIHWLSKLQAKITDDLNDQQLTDVKRVKSLLNISFILGDAPAFQYFSRRYVLTMVPRYQSATTVQSSLLVFNNDVDDFLIPDMRLEGYISDTIQMVVHNLRKLVRVAIWNLTKRNIEGMDANLIQGMEDSGFAVPDFTPDWSKCRCHPVVLGGLLQGLNDKFGLAGICFASPNNPASEQWWTKPCESCDGRPWPLVPGGSLSATFSAFDDVVEKVNQVHERFGGSACTLFLPALQKSLYKIESEIQGFKLQIVERGLHSILGPHWNGDSRRKKIEQCVSLLEEQVLELPDGSKKLELHHLSAYWRQTWGIGQSSPLPPARRRTQETEVPSFYESVKPWMVSVKAWMVSVKARIVIFRGYCEIFIGIVLTCIIIMLTCITIVDSIFSAPILYGVFCICLILIHVGIMKERR
ncbi:hypothetical protein BDZ91DRAFT_713149 [Kalaharituber pfeilii]|nr:hypothetical protein BDZ91DRAFT_713149 [Kalaharituber pfeilii]